MGRKGKQPTKEEIRASLEQQLKDQGADVLHFQMLLDDYMFFYGMLKKMKADNVMGLYSNGYEGIALIDCVCDKIIPAKINNGSGLIQGCRITDTPMFIWATNCRITAAGNEVSICDTGLDRYYHVYYVDQDSELHAINNRIRCDVSTPYHDVFHLMTAGNDGTYRATGLIQGDTVVGNFQSIIDCHYTDLVLESCSITNTNSAAWTEFNNMAHSSFAYRDCDLHYEGASGQTYDQSISDWVLYHHCRLFKNATLNRRAVYNGSKIAQSVSGGIIANMVDVLNCEMRVSGSPQCIGVTTGSALTANFVGNFVEFEVKPSSNYLFNYASFTGNIANNVIVNAKSTKVWETDRGGAHNNIINGEVV